MVHVLEPGVCIQNSYLALAQPEALAVMVIAVPEACGDAGAADAVRDVQGVVVSVYAVPGTKTS